MGGAAVGVDIEAVRGGVHGDDLGARGAQGGRPDDAGGPVGGVHHNAQAGDVGPHGVHKVADVGLVGHRLTLDDTPDGGAGGVGQLGGQGRLDLVLDGVLQLVAAPGEELDAVVGEGVVGGGDDHAQVHVLAGGEVGDGGGGQDAHAGDVHAGGSQAGANGVVQELPGRTGVTPDDGAGTQVPGVARVGRVGGGQDPGGRLPQVQGEVRGEQVVGQAAHTVSAEKTCHG